MDVVDPLRARLWSRVTNGDLIDSGQWSRAKAASEFVGECRNCGGYLLPGSIIQVGRIEWYEARCVACGHEVAAPGGRILRRSARWSEQPANWWEQRIEAMSR